VTPGGLVSDSPVKPLVIGLVAGESSGDQLGARLMESLMQMSGRPIRFVGIGGPLMEAKGLKSLFPMGDIAVNGVLPVIARLPLLLRRIRETAAYLAASHANIVVHIDAQDFNQRVARKLKQLIPETPLIGYVSPTVWAWRPGRAKKIRPLFKQLLAVLPFETEAHRRLGGPDTVYVGHPLMERQQAWNASAQENAARAREPYTLLILPGSRQTEISRLLPLFADAVAALSRQFPGLEIMLPAVDHLAEAIEAMTADWAVRPRIIRGEAEKWQAFRTARAALAASGTVTLELALANVPTVVAYRVSYLEEQAGKVLIKTRYASLPNIILERPLLPEFIPRGWTGTDLAEKLAALLADGKARTVQLDGFAEIRAIMAVDADNPSDKAARCILDTLG
jgi:lipid-A-disaccharide synthase